MPPCDRCDLELLVSSAAFLISWINTSLGRELREISDQFPLRSSRWQHLWKSCPLKGRPLNISARADWVSKVQPMKQASSQMTGYSKLDFALSFCCFPSAHCKIAFPHGYIWCIYFRPMEVLNLYRMFTGIFRKVQTPSFLPDTNPNTIALCIGR